MREKAAYAFSMTALVFAGVCAGTGNGQRTALGLGLDNQAMTARLMSPIGTKTSKRGDTLVAQVLSPAQYQGAIILGRVTIIRRAQQHTVARLSFTLETLTLRGMTYRIRAQLTEAANSHGAKQRDEEGRALVRTQKKKAVDATLPGEVVGAAVGTILGNEKGAAVAAAGGNATLVIETTFSTDSPNVEFAPGSEFSLLVSDR